MLTYPQKITFGEMRAFGVRDVLVIAAIIDAATTSKAKRTGGSDRGRVAACALARLARLSLVLRWRRAVAPSNGLAVGRLRCLAL
jgi:hypothetical protein